MKIPVSNEFLVGLAFIHHFSAKNNVRECLNNVLLEGDGEKCNIVATTGYYLSVAEVECKTEKEFTLLIPIPWMKTILGVAKDSKHHNEAGYFEFEPETNQPVRFISASNHMIAFERGVGLFPNWKIVIPSNNRSINIQSVIGFDSAYLALCNKALKFANNFRSEKRKISNQINFSFGSSPVEATVITYPNEGFENIKTVIMPMKV